jgi:hypothetical protein
MDADRKRYLMPRHARVADPLRVVDQRCASVPEHVAANNFYNSPHCFRAVAKSTTFSNSLG